MESHEDLDAEEVVFEDNSLEKAMRFAEDEWDWFHGDEKTKYGRDKVREHKYPDVQ